MKKIIYFLLPKLIDPDLDKVSGGTISNLRMIEQISESHKVICIPMLCKSIPQSLIENKSVLLELPIKSNCGRIQYIFERYSRYENRVLNMIKKNGPGVLVGTRATINAAHKLSSKLKEPLVIITRAFEDLEQAGLRAPSDKRTMFRRVEGMLNRDKIVSAYRAADLVVTNSEYMKQEHCRLFGTIAQWHVSYPLMDLPRGEPVVNPITTIGFVNKGARKGQELILALARRMPEKEFLIYGTPLNTDGLGICNVKNVGYVSDRVAMFGSVDLFLVPSVWDEPYGRVAAEAIWCGRPVIVSEKGGLPEAAPNDLFWVSNGDVERWKGKIDHFADPSNRVLVRGAIHAAQERIAAQSDCIAEKLLNLRPA